MNYIKWHEEDSRHIKGLVICELPPISKPQMRVSETIVDGVDGSIVDELGYSPYDKPLVIGVTQYANIDEIVKLFSGSGEVVFSNEPDKFYKAQIISQVDYSRLARFKTATVVFHVQPYKYKLDEMPVTISTTPNVYSVENWGTETSKPLIRLNGSGTITCKLNGNTIFSYTFPNGESEVYIDSETQDAYLDSALKNRNMNGEFPFLNPGINEFEFSGNLTSVEISARSRWL